MKKILFSILLSGTICMSAHTQFGQYAISKIPDTLLKNANAVIRTDITRVELKSLNKMITRTRFAITILNEQGSRYADVHEFYDKFQTIDKFEGRLFNASGLEIKSLKKQDIRDMSATSQVSFADDSRVKAHNFYYKTYPYTIEYEIDVSSSQSMFFPSWRPVRSGFLSVQQSSLTMITLPDYLLRYREFNYSSKPEIREADGKKEYTWQLFNFPALIPEYASPALYKITPSVFLAPSEFVIEDYKGNMQSWEELGKFQYSLNKGRNVLPPAVKQKVQSLISGLQSNQEKVFALYNFLQQNTRYVSIQLGIGGWRPYDAAYVSSKGYGDCKALSNYMQAMLQEAGIRSYFTLIRAGDNEDDLKTDFPSIQFNHAILCVPDAKDSIWLECTDQFKSPGYMGGFTGNRHALLITEEGGRLVRTPVYNSNDNLQNRVIKATLSDEGKLTAEVRTAYHAMQQDQLHLMLNNLSKDQVKEYLDEQLDFATYAVQSFNYRESKGVLPAINEELKLEADHYASVSGKRLFLVPNVMNRSQRKLKENNHRQVDIVLRFPYLDTDTTEIILPSGYIKESVPVETLISSRFGKYHSATHVSDGKLIYTRSFEQFSGIFPGSAYNEMVKFYDDVYKADRTRVVMVRDENPKKPF